MAKARAKEKKPSKAKSKRAVKRAEKEAGIPDLKTKPISKPAYAAVSFASRDRKTPIVSDKKVDNWLGFKTVVWM